MMQQSRYAFAILTCAAITLSGCSTAAERTDSGSEYSRGTASNRATSIQVPSGSMLVVAIDERLRTDTHKSGDRFTAHTTQAVTANRTTVFPEGSKVTGRLVHVEEPHRTAGKAKMSLVFESIVDRSGKTHAITTEMISLEGQGDKISDEEKVAGGAVIGGIIGALTSKNKGEGAATGAVAGAAAGGAIAVATKGPQLELPPGQRFAVELTRPVEVQIAAVDN